MNQALELHDSTLKSIKITGNNATLKLDKAIVHKSTGAPGVDIGTCWEQIIDIEIGEVSPELIPEDLPNDIDYGHFLINGKKYVNMLTHPINECGEIEIFVETMYGKKLHLKGKSIKSKEIGEMEFLQNFDGLR